MTSLQWRSISPLVLASSIVAMLVVIWLRVTLNFNTPYLDECDYLFVGRLLTSGVEWKTQTYIFSSNIPLYIFGVADKLGGYLAGRAFAMVLGIFSLVSFYHAIKHLLNDRSTAFIAVFLLSLQAPHIFISKFATYDIVCLTFFMPALWCLALVLREDGQRRLLYVVLCAILCFLAVISKYIALAYSPLFFLAILWRDRKAAAVFFGVGAGLLASYIWWYRGDLMLLYQNQILGDHQPNSTYLQIIGIVLQYTALLGVLAIVGASVVRHKGLLPQAIGLLVCALPLLVYHIRGRDLVSLNKHAVYAVIFLVPLVAAFLRQLVFERKQHRFSQGGVILIIAAMVALSLYQVREMERSYPNTTNITSYILQHSTQQTKIMSEDEYLFRYYCYPKLGIPQMSELTWFDNNLDGKFERQDVIDGIWDGKFDYVYINELSAPFELRHTLIEGVLPHSYEKVYEESYVNSEVMNRHNVGKMILYKLKAKP